MLYLAQNKEFEDITSGSESLFCELKNHCFTFNQLK